MMNNLTTYKISIKNEVRISRILTQVDLANGSKSRVSGSGRTGSGRNHVRVKKFLGRTGSGHSNLDRVRADPIN